MRCLYTLVLLAVGVMVAPGGCTVDVDREFQLPAITQSKVEIKEIPLGVRRKHDFLIVIDSAPSMAGEQDTLAANAPVWMDVLSQIEGGLPDLHLAVVDSNLGTMGVDVGDVGCEGGGSGGRMTTYDCGVEGEFLASELDAWGERRQNFAGTVQETFACMATSVGARGCTWRQPLAAMRRALAHGEQNGFLRDDAYLTVIFIGDGDDCSAADPALYGPASPGDPRDPFRCFAHGVVCDGVDDPSAPGPRTGCRPREDGLLRSIEDYRAGLLALKVDRRDVMVAAVTPAGEIVVEPGPQIAEGCRAGTSAGTPAIRMRTFVQSFMDRNTFTTICDSDWTEVLIGFAELLRTVIGYPCIEAQPVDIDNAPGLQPEIGAVLLQLEGDDIRFQTVLPPCDGAHLPCLRVEPDPINCAGTPSTLGIWIEPPYIDVVNSYASAQILVE